MNPVALDACVAWLLTYALHSTLLLGGAWLLAALLGRRRAAVQEALLRVALLGGLATATLQVGLGVGPLRIDLRPSTGTAPGAAAAPGAGVRPELAAARPSAGEPRAPMPRYPWSGLLVAGWCLGAGLGAARLARSERRLRDLLRDRRSLPAGRAIRRLASALGVRRSVRVSLSRRIAVPFAVGLRRPEVCLPERAAHGLEPPQREALFAHELAHHARRDPSWLVVYRVVESLLFFQPLNRLARVRLQALAECRCDDAAVRCTGRPLELARCLVEVAGWAIPVPVPVAALATRSSLSRRVERLLHAQPEAAVGAWLLPALAVAVLLLGGTLPGVDLAAPPAAEAAVSGESTPAPTPPEAPEAPAPPDAPEPPASRAGDTARLERELERLSAQLAARSAEQREEMKELEAKVEALVAAIGPRTAELERLGEEIERRLAERTKALEGASGEAARRQAEALVREAQRQMEELGADLEPTAEELRRLSEEMRALAAASRPSRQQVEELQRKARELAAAERDEVRQRAEELRRQEGAAKRKSEEVARQVAEERRRAEGAGMGQQLPPQDGGGS